MKSIQTRTYTNVALTAIIILLALLLIRPYALAPQAYAQMDEPRNVQQTRTLATLNPNADNAKATEQVAAATREIASAIREAAKSQEQIAQALLKLGESTK